MNNRYLKKFELLGKHFLSDLLQNILPKNKSIKIDLNNLKRVLVLRLDQKIGNGLLILPLIKAVRKSIPKVEIHLLLHQPVCHLIQSYTSGLVDYYWPYNQRTLLLNPLHFLKLLIQLRQQKYDLIISSHNPDNFSFSQALLGRLCRPKMLVGFLWEDSKKFYDISVPSSTKKHYAENQFDLLKFLIKSLQFNWQKISIPQDKVEKVFVKSGITTNRGKVLFWLGATGDKKLPVKYVVKLYNLIKKITSFEIDFALGPHDFVHSSNYPAFIRDKVILWNKPLTETAAFFARYLLFISGDTGPSHLAFVLDIPSLTIFMNNNIQQYGYHDREKHFSYLYSKIRENDKIVINALKILHSSIRNKN